MKRIPDSFSGALDINEKFEKCCTSFSVSNHVVTLIPLTGTCSKHNDEEKCIDDLSDDNRWIFGYAEDNCRIAILRNTHLSTRISPPNNLSISKFSAPIIVKSMHPGEVDLSTFDIIEFRGGIVDIVHMPSLSCQIDNKRPSIEFRDPNSYTKTYSVNLNNEPIEITYSVDMSELAAEMSKVPDLRNDIHSVLRFNFNCSQKLSDINKFYSYALTLFQFCCARQNVCFETRLYKKALRKVHNAEELVTLPILVKLQDDFNDYANEMLQSLEVIRLNSLGDKLPNLIKILAEEKTKPLFQFLPRRNIECNNIKYTDVTDLCVAFDKEFRIRSIKGDEKENSTQRFCKEIEKFISDIKYSDELKNRAKGLLGNLKNPSPKMVITYFYNKFEKSLQIITQPEDHDKYGVVKFYSTNEFIALISKFVDIRNKVAHMGVARNEGIEIFVHLKVLIYFCVLNRAKYSAEESSQILSWLFGRFF